MPQGGGGGPKQKMPGDWDCLRCGMSLPFIMALLVFKMMLKVT